MNQIKTNPIPMDSSIFIARLGALVFFVLALALFFNADYYKKAFTKLTESPILVYSAGILSLIAGFTLVYYRSLWIHETWGVFLTILGVVALLKGVLILVFPHFSTTFFKPMLKSKNLHWLSLAPLLLAILLAYFGFLV